MGNYKHCAAYAILMLFFTACSITPVTNGETGGTDGGPSSIPTTAYTHIITKTPTISPTPTVTATPTFTPTPPPDLELTDVTILPNTYNVVDQNYSIMARLRNNTDTTMVIFDVPTVLKMTFDRWEYDEQGKMDRGPYYHSLDTGDLQPSEGYYMNFIIYPGEEGVVAFEMFDLSSTDDHMISNQDKYDGPLGITYTYQSFNHFRPDLPTYYHTKAENVTFQIKDYSVAYDFDLNVPALPIMGVATSVEYYVIFYDKNNKIIDVMQKYMNHYPGFEFGKKLHIHDNTASAIFTEIFLDMTSDMASQVDHLDIINEMTRGGM